MTRVLAILAAASFTTGLFARMTDPMVPMIAGDLGVDAGSVALLATAFALPWALVQPVVGPLGDLVGKTRVVTVCLTILLASAVVGALATNYPVILISRIVAGAAAGGISPVSMAFVADTVPMQSRQVAMGRLLTAGITGILLGGTLSGVIADFVGWRGIFVVVGVFAAGSLAAALIGLRGASGAGGRPASIAAAIENYRQVLANPQTKVCYGAVFLEGVALFGIFPYVAILLLAGGEARASIAGLVISGFAIGGIVYALAIRRLLLMFRSRSLMVAGGALASVALLVEAAAPAWPVQWAALTVMGFGFYLLHGAIMVLMSELAPGARGTAVAGHASAFYMGQGIGPVVYGLGFAALGPALTMILAAVLMLGIGIATSRLLYPRAVAP